MKRFLTQPFADALGALERGIGQGGAASLGWVALGCALSWWAYVPLHELMHAWGCQLAGGTVTRLDIAQGYGGSFLQKVFPYVRVGSDYAGQLTGFDTHGSDLTYAATVAFPYLLTLFPGVPLLVRTASRSHSSAGASFALGAALPLAWAPFLSFGGDYYELGSIAASRLAELLAGVDGRGWRGDDVFLIAGRDGLRPGDVAGIAGSLLLGLLLAFATYALGRRLARVR